MSKKPANEHVLGVLYDIVNTDEKTVLVCTATEPMRSSYRRTFAGGGQMFLKDRHAYTAKLVRVWLGNAGVLDEMRCDRAMTLLKQGHPVQNALSDVISLGQRTKYAMVQGRFTVYELRHNETNELKLISIADASRNLADCVRQHFVVDGLVDEKEYAAYSVTMQRDVVGTLAQADALAAMWRRLAEAGRRPRQLVFMLNDKVIEPVDLPRKHLVYAIEDDRGKVWFVGVEKRIMGDQWFADLVATRRAEVDDSTYYVIRVLAVHDDQSTAYADMKTWVNKLHPVNSAVRGVAATDLTDEERAEYIRRTTSAATERMCRRAIRCLDTGEVYGGITQAARTLKLSPKILMNVVDGKQVSVNNMRFEYAEPEPIKMEFACEACGEWRQIADRVVVEQHELCDNCAKLLQG